MIWERLAKLVGGGVPGGGVALLRCLKAMESLKLEGDQKVGADIVRKAVEAPLRWIATALTSPDLLTPADTIGHELCFDRTRTLPLTWPLFGPRIRASRARTRGVT